VSRKFNRYRRLLLIRSDSCRFIGTRADGECTSGSVDSSHWYKNAGPCTLKHREAGRCIVKTISQSTGFAELDKNCLSAAQEAPFVPGKQNGAAVGAWTNIIMVWQPGLRHWANQR
jgi:hypothetical protein